MLEIMMSCGPIFVPFIRFFRNLDSTAGSLIPNTHKHLPRPTSGFNVVHPEPFLLMLNPTAD